MSTKFTVFTLDAMHFFEGSPVKWQRLASYPSRAAATTVVNRLTRSGYRPLEVHISNKDEPPANGGEG